MRIKAATPPTVLPTTTLVPGVEAVWRICDAAVSVGYAEALFEVVVALEEATEDEDVTIVELELPVEVDRVVDGTENDMEEALRLLKKLAASVPVLRKARA